MTHPRPAPDWTEDDRVTRPLDDADLLHLAVAGRNGPLVTPLAFDRRGRELWLLTARNSAKIRAIRRDPRVGVLVRLRGRSVIARGRAHLVDPLSGRGLATMLRPDLPLTALHYLARHERRVVGTLLDRPSPTLPLTRTAVRITVEAVAVLDMRGLRAAWGSWAEGSAPLTGDGVPPMRPDLTGVPAALHPLLAGDTAAALGWDTPDGPVALPARWRADGSIRVPAGALELAGAVPAGPACLTVQRSGDRISSVRGLLLAGPGRAGSADGSTTVAIGVERISWWRGEETGTVRIPAPGTTGLAAGIDAVSAAAGDEGCPAQASSPRARRR